MHRIGYYQNIIICKLFILEITNDSHEGRFK